MKFCWINYIPNWLSILERRKLFHGSLWIFLVLKYWRSPVSVGTAFSIHALLEAAGASEFNCYFTGWPLEQMESPGTSGLQCGGPQPGSRHLLLTPSVLVIIRVGPMLPPHQSVVSNAHITQVSQVVYSVVDTTRLHASSANSFCPSDHKGWPNATATPVCGK